MSSHMVMSTETEFGIYTPRILEPTRLTYPAG